MEDLAPTPEVLRKLSKTLALAFPHAELKTVVPLPLGDLRIPPNKVMIPRALAEMADESLYGRVSHTYGKSFKDVVRGLRGYYPTPPDVVMKASCAADVARVLDWCADARLAIAPYGGGSSVVGGFELGRQDDFAGTVIMDLSEMEGLVDLDLTSRSALLRAGTLGPALEDSLRPHGLSLRHFPQSFEYSSLGGWIATRAGGHYATLTTHIDDFVESLEVVTPTGMLTTRKLPASGAGPRPEAIFLGSEGSLGVITAAWMRVQDRPKYKESQAVGFKDFLEGVEATRKIIQSGLYPANCRVLDAKEAAVAAGVTDGSALLLLGFESAHHPVTALLKAAVEVACGHGGSPRPAAASVSPSSAEVQSWRNSFIRAPYTRDALVLLGAIVETFETACTWEMFPDLYRDVTMSVAEAVRKACGDGYLTTRTTHLYPDGVAPYFSVFAPGRQGSELSQWEDIKAVANEAILRNGGTATHHHAVGREHRAMYHNEAGALYLGVLRGAKGVLDPSGILNPGVLL